MSTFIVSARLPGALVWSREFALIPVYNLMKENRLFVTAHWAICKGFAATGAYEFKSLLKPLERMKCK